MVLKRLVVAVLAVLSNPPPSACANEIVTHLEDASYVRSIAFSRDRTSVVSNPDDDHYHALAQFDCQWLNGHVFLKNERWRNLLRFKRLFVVPSHAVSDASLLGHFCICVFSTAIREFRPVGNRRYGGDVNEPHLD